MQQSSRRCSLEAAAHARMRGDPLGRVGLLLSTLSLVGLAACEVPSRSRAAPNHPPAWGAPPAPMEGGQPPPGQAYPGQPYPGQPYPGQPQPGQPQPGQIPAPGSQVKWVQVPRTNTVIDLRWGPTLTDVMQHKPPREKDTWPDLATTGHETIHGHSFDLRLTHSRERPHNGFYVLGGVAAVVAEPSFRKAHVAAFVPPSLRRSRYSHYLVGQAGWDGRPLYVWDEWNAYIIGAKIAAERYSLGLEPHRPGNTSDRIHAVLEFTIYAAVLLVAAQQYDPQHVARGAQLLEFFAFNAERAMAVFNQGRNLPPFAWPDSAVLEANLRTAADAEPLRGTLRHLYGPEWTRSVFGF